MLSSLSTQWFIWFYLLCVMIMMQTQLNAAQGNCKDNWSGCEKYKTTYCKKNDVTKKTMCKKTCGMCGDPSQANCRDLWPNCEKYKTTYCKNNDITRKQICPKTCGACGGICKDLWSVCKNRKTTYCKKNYITKNIACKKTCGTCKDPSQANCRDLWPTCEKYKTTYCKKNYVMKKKCKKSCGMCGGSAQADCNNIWPDCSIYTFYCTRRNSEVKKNCRKTCGLCGTGEHKGYIFNGNQRMSPSVPNNIPSKTTGLLLAINQFTQLKDNEFSHLKRLRSLHLYFNLISKINAQTFNGLNSIDYIDLHNNQITSISAGAFAQLTTLRFLNLYSNKLSTISQDVFSEAQMSTSKPFERRLFMFLRSNPLVCDSTTRWIKEYVVKQRVRCDMDPCPKISIKGSAPAVCQDILPDCRIQTGNCAKMPSMRDDCKKSCGFC